MTGLEDSPLIGNDTTRSRTRPYVPAMLKFTAPTPAQLVALVPRRAWRWMLRGAVFAMVLPVLLQWLLAYVVGSDARIMPPQLQAAKNLLIVTAHPDDECLFFAPSILGVLDRNRAVTGGLLVMSTGMWFLCLPVGIRCRFGVLLTTSREQLRHGRPAENGARGLLPGAGH